MKIGILAYGSLIDDPGEELSPIIEMRKNVETPFKVEYARSSSSRDGAPTLVPVNSGGTDVKATLLVLLPDNSLRAIKDMLYRREIHQPGNLAKTYNRESASPNAVQIKEIHGEFGLDIVLYAFLSPNIEEIKGAALANLAIQSAQGEAGKKGKDGITYLMKAVQNGIQTPLTAAYQQAILDKTKTSSLQEALRKLTL